MADGFNPVESEFNSGLAIIYQLDAIEKGLIRATLSEDHSLHYRMLVSYFKTLCNQANAKEEAEQIVHWEMVRNNFRKYEELKKRGDRTIPSSLLDCLDWWEIQLRNLKQKHGLGMPTKDARYTGKR